MKLFRKEIVLLIVSLAIASMASTLYENSFESTDGWVVMAAQSTPSIVGNKMVVDNSVNSAPSILLHNDNGVNSAPVFTFTTDLIFTDSSNERSGVLFCFDGVAITGYSLSISAQKQFSLVRWDGGTPTTIITDWNSFISDSLNTIKVSKIGNDISIFCNDEFLGKFTDKSYNSGDIALLIAPNSSVIYDNLLVTDKESYGVTRDSFADNFDDDTLAGWRVYSNNGTITEKNNQLDITTESGRTLIYTNGYYKNASCSIVVKRTGSNKNGYYGIAFINIIPDSAMGLRFFQINGNRSVKITEGNSYIPIKNSNITGDVDTITVTSNHTLKINGSIVDDSTFTDGGMFNGIAIISDSGVDVSVLSFKAQGEGAPIAINNNIINYQNSSIKSSIIGGAVYDIRGRQVASFSSSNYRVAMKNLGAGQFFIVGKDRLGNLVSKSIIKR